MTYEHIGFFAQKLHKNFAQKLGHICTKKAAILAAFFVPKIFWIA